MTYDQWPLKATPFEIQRIAFNKSIQHPRFGHFLEQGLGKTPINFADFLYFLGRDEIDCNIVIAPSYLKSGWAGEAELHGVNVPVFTWPRVPDAREFKQPFIFVINTEALLHSGGKTVEYMLGVKRCMLTVDESVCIANHQSKISKRVLVLGQEATHHRALSGLPNPENVMQWWPQLRFCGALNGVNPYSFRNRFAVMGGYMGKKVTGVKNQEELQEILDSCSIRALKADWLDLPEKVYMPPIEFELTAKQMAAYKSMQADFFTEVDHGEVFANQVVHQLMKLQQISRGFVIDEGNVHEIVEPDENPAIKALLFVLSQTLGKSIVFTYYEYSTRTVHEQLTRAGYKPIVLRGGLDTEEIKNRKLAFNQDRDVRVAVMQLSVGAKGHTMLGLPDDRCATTIFYENTYSRDTRSQAEDRNHRIGQDANSVNYFDLVESVKGSVTRKALEALRRKQDFVDATLNAIRTRR